MTCDRKELVMRIVRRLLQRGIDAETVVDIALDLYDELGRAAPTQPVGAATAAQASAQTATTATQAAAQQFVIEGERVEGLRLVEKGICPRCGREFASIHICDVRVFAYHGRRSSCYIGKIKDFREAGIDIIAVRERIRESRLATPGGSPPQPGPGPGWREMLERGVCPKCGEQIRFITVRASKRVYAKHGSWECYLTTVDRLESAGIDIEAVRSAIAARREAELRERLSRWAEKLRQRICPKCGGEILSFWVAWTTGHVYAWHGGWRCYLASVKKLEEAGIDVRELLGRPPRARPKRKSPGPEELREWFERLRQGVCPRCERVARSLGIDSRGVVTIHHGKGDGGPVTCRIATLEKLKAAGIDVLDVIGLKLTLRGLRKAGAAGQSLQPSPPVLEAGWEA